MAKPHPPQGLLVGDVREILPTLPDESVHCVVTSPPYWGLRDYGVDGQIGLESTLDEWVSEMVAVFAEVRRVLRNDGTCWLNLGDAYNAGTRAKRALSPSVSVGGWELNAGGTGERIAAAGLKPKDLLGQPWRVAFALQADGWWLRSDIIWSKPNPMPESVTDRPTAAHEHIFLLTKQARYFYNAEAVKQPDSGHASGNGYKRAARLSLDGRGQDSQWQPGGGANLRNVWELTPEPFAEAHFATFPTTLVERCIAAGCPEQGTVFDPFMGSGTVAEVAERMGRQWLGIELNPDYAAMARRRSAQRGLALGSIDAQRLGIDS